MSFPKWYANAQKIDIKRISIKDQFFFFLFAQLVSFLDIEIKLLIMCIVCMWASNGQTCVYNYNNKVEIDTNFQIVNAIYHLSSVHHVQMSNYFQTHMYAHMYTLRVCVCVCVCVHTYIHTYG